MRAYLDTGIFIDYLSQRGNLGLRTAGRRGRTQAQVFADVEKVLDKLTQRHQCVTSALTFYEVEEALYRLLSRSAKGVPRATSLLVPAARAIALQTAVMVNIYDIAIADLTKSIIDSQIRELTFQLEGIRSADALHLTTARNESADIFVTSDDWLLALDGKLANSSAIAMRCVDTDTFLTLI